VLAARIEARVHQMMEAGLLDEVRALAGTGMSRTAAQALGYKELLAHLDGACTYDAAVEQIVIRTRQFGVRQLRWFQRDPRVRWIDIEHDPVAEAAPTVLAALTA
jgi:tRNA dimethylallyltransferase